MRMDRQCRGSSIRRESKDGETHIAPSPLLIRIHSFNSFPFSLQILSNHPTAQCICLIHKESRCLVANIGASTHFDSVEIIHELSTLRPPPAHIYIEGYFVPHKISLCQRVYENFCGHNGCQLILNLNATYIVERHSDDLLWLFHRSSLVFGNRREFEALLRVAQAEDIPELLSHSLSGKVLCVITDGPRSVEYVQMEGAAKLVTRDTVVVSAVPENKVLDSTGCGDAFVAGFLFRYLQAEETRLPVTECIRYGVEVAQRKLGYFGCTIRGEETNLMDKKH